jgi:regulator of sigma E protease
MEIGSRIGMTFLLLLMSFAIFNDLQRLIGG